MTAEDRRGVVERAVFADSSVTYQTSIFLDNIAGNGAVVQSAVPHDLVEGDSITFRGLRWRRDGKVTSEGANFDSYRVGTVLSAVRFHLLQEDGSPVDTAAEFGEYVPAVTAGASIVKQVASVGGLARFAGQDVALLLEGGAATGTVGEDGVLVLPGPSGVVTVGAPYRMRVTTLPRIGYGGAAGDDTGQPTSFDSVVLKLLDTIGGEVGRGNEPVLPEPLPMATWDDPVDRPPVLFSGDKILPISSVPDEDPVITYTSSDPYPVEVLGIYLCAQANMP